jgi:hypothetical protein
MKKPERLKKQHNYVESYKAFLRLAREHLVTEKKAD